MWLCGLTLTTAFIAFTSRTFPNGKPNLLSSVTASHWTIIPCSEHLLVIYSDGMMQDEDVAFYEPHLSHRVRCTWISHHPFTSFASLRGRHLTCKINLSDMPSDPHLEGQTRILTYQPAFSCSKFVLALME